MQPSCRLVRQEAAHLGDCSEPRQGAQTPETGNLTMLTLCMHMSGVTSEEPAPRKLPWSVGIAGSLLAYLRQPG